MNGNKLDTYTFISYALCCKSVGILTFWLEPCYSNKLTDFNGDETKNIFEPLNF